MQSPRHLGLVLNSPGFMAALLVLSSALQACLVQGRSYRSSQENDRPCRSNDDCALNQICKDQMCQSASGCTKCTDAAHGKATCFHGTCLVEVCESGYWDANGLFQDGCEYACIAKGEEICNEEDDDCDGRTDEDFDLLHDPNHCGSCTNTCPLAPHAEPLCNQGICSLQCESGWFDNNADSTDGCESNHCEITAGGHEICDLRDNDCDGSTDEDIPKDLPTSCGPLCDDCRARMTGAQVACHSGQCKLVACLPGHHDLDQDASNGCEYACIRQGDEVCNGEDDDCNGLTDEGLTCSCPQDMVLVEDLFCMDRYEASRPDATATSQGQDSSRALSRAGVMPWMNSSFSDASAACEAAGKRLCTPEEWEQACKGPASTTYSYGDVYDPTTCNGIDAFCRCGPDSPCSDQDPCPYPHCYWDCGADFHPVPTGSFPNCTNAYGIYDINGNVWERVSDGAGRGGAFNCGDSEALHRCDYVADWGTQAHSNFGFRCCCRDCPTD